MSGDSGLDKESYMPVISRSLRLVKGRGCYVWDDSGKKYLDCVAGIAVCNTGHCHPKVVEAICRQAGELIHTSNLYYPPNQETFAKKLVEITGMSKGSVFMCNSGAEANEAALKLARLRTGMNEYIAFVNAFHGRIATPLSVTYKPAIREPFEPFGPKRSFIEYGDAEALSETITRETAAVIVEGIQGEAGVIPAPEGFYRTIREVCDDYGALMIADEIQTGFGRTGEWFYYQNTGATPDIVSMAKGIASGLPMGAIVAREGLSFNKGEHGSTFAGGPVVCAAGLATIGVLNELIPDVERKGERFRKNLSKRNPRGLGLMIGIDAGDFCDQIRESCLAGGLLVNCTGKGTIRLLPPLIIENDEIDFASGVIDEAFDKAGL
jgi:acetylornithine/N-succinyldiaminopimelate aminotransferase